MSRTDVNAVGTQVLDMKKPIPKDWKKSVISSRHLKAQCGSGRAAHAALRCAEDLIEKDNCLTTLYKYGASIVHEKGIGNINFWRALVFKLE